ncbi:cellulose biosynthesis protein BcsE [Enterobacteriaceae bacterium YMB-R22]|jgi:cellulose biosynthesis protein BcsE|uniref:cellulose biosynthesis protein BcsE n=1 Tax=Tenebrionicola larvae TaxID=2815733 RepID=UPI002011D487|nr:cellulose biosynthesis protein BcsE [Tenebrionicola larvae]MBV4414479.1 cellulose biosynthesis protein BcsE [Tenebrionicola larvae]
MSPIFLVGIQALWDELQHMPAGGIWWINTDRVEDAHRLINSTIAAQHEHTKVAAIVMDKTPNKVITPVGVAGPQKISLFGAKKNEQTLHFFATDIMCSINPEHYFLIMLWAENFWQDISPQTLRNWLDEISEWCRLNKCTLLMVNPGNKTDAQFSFLMDAHRSLSGLASLRYQADAHLYDVAFWCNEKGVSAQQQLEVAWRNDSWQARRAQEPTPQPRSDEKRILSHAAVLEGAPPLSEHWTLFDDNTQLFEAARGTQAATIIFSLSQNNQIDALAHNIHTLRRQRGSALKIIVRESKASLRTTDERLLLSCGATLVVPWNAPLSRCLTMVESVQGQTFSRRVPQDILLLFNALRPLKLRGWLPWDAFCNAIHTMLNNPLLPADNKGVLVALRPVPGLRIEQALTLCRPNRMGDFVTIGNGRLLIFLSFCRITDLDTALDHIFPLPVNDIISNRMAWYEDAQIAAELVQLENVPREQWAQPLAHAAPADKAVNARPDNSPGRRVPQPITLLADRSANA